MALDYDHLVDRVHSRLEGLAVLLEHRQPDALARSARRFVTWWPDDRAAVTEEARGFLDHLEPIVVAGVFKALRPGMPAGGALAVARALWRLLDQDEDASRREELSNLGQRLKGAMGRCDGAEAARKQAELLAWCERHEWALLAAVRRLLDAP